MSTDTTVDAATPASAPRDHEAPHAGHVPGELGTWFFIFADLVIFTALFAAYLHDRDGKAELFTASQAQLEQTLGVVNTVVLLVSSLLVATGVRAFRRGLSTLAVRMFAGAIACGVTFAVVKFFEYRAKVDADIGMLTNEFWTYYFGLTGIHLLHVCIGVGILTYCLLQARRPAIDATHRSYVESGATFWHMVDLLWIVLFPLLYLAH
ncbi:cytochrome c oxidase subunit 3 [Patulibacter brassicae]|uniref:Cytochrome aa3 subunit 3 n=1 Tax=Patulibacter brassicae TaxID=1705717 RepID=A0ABU4VJ05_9ACTN|nr:cytochrome c oxidase subunit 3 [Patulibacter brassicae]MDX8151778.1 cytochrome c oxidase subunit 3 [Patulibacter brassicae]